MKIKAPLFSYFWDMTKPMKYVFYVGDHKVYFKNMFSHTKYRAHLQRRLL